MFFYIKIVLQLWELELPLFQDFSLWFFSWGITKLMDHLIMNLIRLNHTQLNSTKQCGSFQPTWSWIWSWIWSGLTKLRSIHLSQEWFFSWGITKLIDPLIMKLIKLEPTQKFSADLIMNLIMNLIRFDPTQINSIKQCGSFQPTWSWIWSWIWLWIWSDLTKL